jgi:hypothetical protein
LDKHDLFLTDCVQARKILIVRVEWVFQHNSADFKALNYMGTNDYAQPGTNNGRSYDVWAMGCIGCEILVWLKHGAAGVRQFRSNRRHVGGGPVRVKMIVYNFHCGEDIDDLQPAVRDVLLEAKKRRRAITGNRRTFGGYTYL